jgi:glycosyltransferase involved in cell wall biosynthesis
VPISSPCEDGTWLASVGLEPQKYILSVSRISEEKGILELMSAFEEAGLAKQGLKLAIAGEVGGNGSFKRKVRQRAACVPGAVLLGQMSRSNLPMLYGGASLFVNASAQEGMSFSALEALSHGCSCLFSDIRANRFKVSSIRWFDLKRPGALSQALKDALFSKPMSAEDRTAQQDDLNRHYNVQTTARLTQDALDTAARQSRAYRLPSAPVVAKKMEK